MPPERCSAFAPGRVNLIGEHTDYNRGLALPFAIAEGVTVHAQAAHGRVEVTAADLGETDVFDAASPQPAPGWRAYARGVVGELAAAGVTLAGAAVQIESDLPAGAGLSSSAALEVALCLALLNLAGTGQARGLDTVALAQLCSRVENEWVGARTGLLDQLASLCGAPERGLLIDFDTLSIEQVPLVLGEWRLVTLDSGERHVHAGSGYNERREECARAAELLGVCSLREADPGAARGLPEPLRSRALHVVQENARVREAAAALRANDLDRLGALLDASHAGLRDLFEVSTPAVEAAIARLREAGATGARLTGGGFGGSVLGLFAPGREPPQDARTVAPGPGARLL